MARRQELSIELVTQLADAAREGHVPHVAARKVGVHKTVFSGWMEAGEQAHLEDAAQRVSDDPVLYLRRQLYERVTEAEAECEMTWVTELKKKADIGKTTWQGYMTLLERRFGDRWRKRDPGTGTADESVDQAFKRLEAEMNARPAGE